MNNNSNNRSSQHNQNQQPSGKILLESLRTTHFGFFGLHLLSQSLLSRALGFSFTLGPRYYEKMHQQIQQNNIPDNKSANDDDDHSENFNDNINNNNAADADNDDDDVSFFKKNLSFRDILDVAVIAIPISVEDVTHSARAFLQQPDYERVLRFAICNLVADRRFGVVTDVDVDDPHANNYNNYHNNNNNNKRSNDDFEREVSQGISLCKTIFNFVATGNRTRMGLPNAWGEGLIRMTRSRIFVCVTKLLCRGLFLADWEEKIRPFHDDENNNNNNDIYDASNSNILTFPLCSHQEIEHLLVKEQQRIHASSVTFSASQTEFLRNNNNIVNTPHKITSSSPFSSSTALISASAVQVTNGGNNNANSPHNFSFVLLCPEVYSLFPSDEGHFLRTTQEGLLHDAMNSFSIDDGIPLIDPWRQEARMLLVSLRLLNEDDEDDDEGDADADHDDGTNYHSMSTFGSGSLVFSTNEKQNQLPQKYRKVGFTDVDATSLGRVIRSNKRKQKETINNNTNGLDVADQENNKVSNPSTFYSGLESLRAFLTVVVSGNSLVHKKAAAIMASKNKSSNDNDNDVNSSPQQLQHLQFLKKLFTHPISAEREKILEVNLISPQTALGEKRIRMGIRNDNDTSAVFFEFPQLVSSDHESSNANQLGLEIVWDPAKFFSSPSRKKYDHDNNNKNHDEDDNDETASSDSSSSSTSSKDNHNNNRHRHTKDITNNFSIPLLRELVQRCLDLLPFDERSESIPTYHEVENHSNHHNNNVDLSTRTSLLRHNRQHELVREPSLASTIRPPSTIAIISSSNKKQLVNEEDGNSPDASDDDEENEDETQTTSSTKRNLHIFKQYPQLRSKALIEECGFPLPGRKFSQTIFDTSKNKDDRTNDDEESREEFLRNPARASRMTQIEEFWDSTNTKTKSKRLQSRRRRQKMRGDNNSNRSNASSSSTSTSSSASRSSTSSLTSSIDFRYGTGDNKDFLEALESSCAPLRLDLTQQVKLLTSSLDTFSLRATMEQLLINFPKMKIAVGGLNDNERRDILTYSFQNVSFVSPPSPTRSTKNENTVEEDQEMTNNNKNNNTFHDNTTIIMEKPDNWFDSSSSSSSSINSTNSSSDDDEDDSNDSSEDDESANDDDEESNANSSADQFSSLLRHCGVAEMLKQFETFPNPKFIPFTPCVENLNEFTKALLSGSYSNQITMINSDDQEKTNQTMMKQQPRDAPQFNFYVAEILLCGLLKSIPLGQACSVVDLCFRILSTFLIQNEKFIQQINPEKSSFATQSNSDLIDNNSSSNAYENTEKSNTNNNNNNNSSTDQSKTFENKNQPQPEQQQQSSASSVASSSPTNNNNASSLHSLRQSPSNIERFRAEFLFETGVMQLFPLLASYALIIKTLLTSLKNSEEISAVQKERGHAAPYQQNNNSNNRNDKKKKKKKESEQKRNLLSPKIEKTTSLVSSRIRSQALQFADTVLALLPDWTSSCLHLLRFANAAASRKEVNLKYLSSLGCIDAAFVNRIDAEKSQVVGPLLSCACLLACEIPNQGAMGLPLCDHPDSILEVVEQLSRRVVDGEFTRTIGRSFKLARDTIGIRDDDDEDDKKDEASCDDDDDSHDGDDDDDDDDGSKKKNKKTSSSSLQSVWPLFCRRAGSIRNALGTRAAFSVLQLLSEDGNETLNPLLKLRLFSRQTVSVLKSSVSYDY